MTKSNKQPEEEKPDVHKQEGAAEDKHDAEEGASPHASVGEGGEVLDLYELLISMIADEDDLQKPIEFDGTNAAETVFGKDLTQEEIEWQRKPPVEVAPDEMTLIRSLFYAAIDVAEEKANMAKLPPVVVPIFTVEVFTDLIQMPAAKLGLSMALAERGYRGMPPSLFQPNTPTVGFKATVNPHSEDVLRVGVGEKDAGPRPGGILRTPPGTQEATEAMRESIAAMFGLDPSDVSIQLMPDLEPTPTPGANEGGGVDTKGKKGGRSVN